MDRLQGIDPQSVLRDVVACVGFYTRIPVPAGIALPDSFATAQWAAPLAGALVGAVGGVALLVALRIGLPANLAAIVALATTLLVTGALHEDGSADVADGFGGGPTRERKLEIMRDSRIGTYGVCVLGLGLLARWSALGAIAMLDGWSILAVLVATHTAARALMPAFMANVANARGDGLAASVGRVQSGPAAVALALGALALLPAGIPFATAAAALLALWFVILKRLCEVQIGGQTGDVLGTLEQGGEIIVLFCACIFLL